MEIDDNIVSGLVVGYWKNYRLRMDPTPEDRRKADRWAWAWDRVDQLISVRHPDSVSILCRLSDAARTEGELAYLGAGPLEDLIHRLDSEPDASLTAALEAALERDSRLAQALHGVAFSTDSMLQARLRRFLRASGSAGPR